MTLQPIFFKIETMIKIGFSGLPDSGKTALCSEVKKILMLKNSVTLLEDISGTIPFDIELQHSFNSYFYLITNQINNEIYAATKNSTYLITDLTLFDYYFRWLFFQKDKKESENISEKKDVLKALFNFWKKSYDLVFFVKSNLQDKECIKDCSSTEMFSYPILLQLEQLYLKNFEKERIKFHEILNGGNLQEAALRAAHIVLRHNES